MPGIRLTDLVVVLPGITGSRLERESKDVWALSSGALFGALLSLGGSIGKLVVPPHDPRKSPPDDGVRATGLIHSLHGVFGLGKIDGYSELVQLVLKNFQVEAAAGDPRAPANFIEFPYDWRLSNRESARRLKAVIDERLQVWRARRAKEAKVILMAHSMGGLISRYYLEVLEGWRDCRALITFGTPFRGSPGAVNYLANGYRKLGIPLSGLTEMMRSCPSVYELMPRYKMLKLGTETRYVGEVKGIPNMNADLARAGLEFHREMDEALERNRKQEAYREQGYVTLPFVGVHQPTLQSAELADGKLTVIHALPDGVDALLDGGDGTVPRLSAIPVEESDSRRETFLGERHSSLQKNVHLLADLKERLIQMQATDLKELRGAWEEEEEEADKKGPKAICLDLEEVYFSDEPASFLVQSSGTELEKSGYQARVERVDAPEPPRDATFVPSGDGWRLSLETLPVGSYRLTVRSGQGGPQAPKPVHERFEVLPATLRTA